MKKIFISTIPFSKASILPLDILGSYGYEIVINPLGRKLQPGEINQFIGDVDGIIAGTELIDESALAIATNLKVISRVGIGLDGVDLSACKAKSIAVTYTADAPAPAVAELTVGLLINLIRFVHKMDKEVRSGGWSRPYGRRIAELKVGVIGVGRVGSRVIRRLSAFGTPELYCHDLKINHDIDRNFKVKWCSKNDLVKLSDVILVHVPLTKKTENMISDYEFSMMKKDVVLINTARGGIVNETALHDFLLENPDSSAAIDVFEQEPYKGPLTKLENIILTSHVGSMTEDCRNRMEIEAVESLVAFLESDDLVREVPEYEYINQQN